MLLLMVSSVFLSLHADMTLTWCALASWSLLTSTVSLVQVASREATPTLQERADAAMEVILIALHAVHAMLWLCLTSQVGCLNLLAAHIL